MKQFRVAIVGATGAVGGRMIKMLEESTIPVASLKLLASKRSVGKKIPFNGQNIEVEELKEDSFEGIDIALFSAGGSVSEHFAPYAVKSGAIVIDNTSHYRMDERVPLVVPEVNSHALTQHQGIIACPNCSTIQMMVALHPIKEAFGLKRVIVSTYQAVSGAGNLAIEETKEQLRKVLNEDVAPENLQADILPAKSDAKHFPIAFNALPQIDVFGEGGYTFEEWKMIQETKKILEEPTLPVAATCVRIPVLSGHSESIYIEIEKENVSVADLQKILQNSEGVILEDDPQTQTYPQAIQAVGKKETFVGRIRKDLDNPKGFHLWVVSDNLLKGAAWNSVQIAEKMIEMNLIQGQGETK